jgi:hypothetical protein
VIRPGRWPVPLKVAGVFALAEGWHVLREEVERWRVYHEARELCDALGKPLLNVDCPRRYGQLKYPCPEVCLDASPWRLAVCASRQPTLADVRAIPFPDKHFGAVICFHVLEHLHTVAAAQQAIAELDRVADAVFVLSPSRLCLLAHLNLDHHLWVLDVDGEIFVAPRDRSSGIGLRWRVG